MYSSLDTSRKEIRLLHLHPAAWNEDIECHLKIVSLYDHPNFRAISYVWGETAAKLPITVDGQRLLVTQNVTTSLQRLRAPDEVLVLWLDAVCINQSDIQERSEQVQYMGEIYNSATEVLICLGYGRDLQAPPKQPEIVHWTGCDTDLELVDSYFKQKIPHHGSNDKHDSAEDVVGLFVFVKLRAMDKHVHEIPFFDGTGQKLEASKAWLAVIRAMQTMSSHPWWTRIWVVQESILAQKATLVYCNITAPWTLLADSTRAAARHIHCCGDLNQTRGGRELRTIVERRKSMYDDLNWLRAARARNKELSLYQVMSRTHLRDATDVRDKVFGVLGLVTNWFGQPPLIPDYSLSPREVFMRVVVRHIESTLSLHILMGTTRAGVPDVPSWVTQRGPTSRSSSSATGHRINRATLFSAAGGRTAKIKRVDDVLVTDAIQPFRTVLRVGSPLPEDHTWDELTHCVTSWRHMAGLDTTVDQDYPSKHSRNEAFWRTIANDTWQPQRLNSADVFSAQLDYCGEIFTAYRRFGNTDVSRVAEGFWEWARSHASEDEKNEQKHASSMHEIRAFHRCLGGSALDRKFFLTTDGYMGMGPPEMIPGDSIAILPGSKVPFCVRAVHDAPQDQYTIVGDTYVHGLMDGEGTLDGHGDEVVQICLH